MGDLVNLRRERKRRSRDAEARAAAQNRIDFGRSKAEKTLTEATLALADRRLEGALRDVNSPESGDDAGA